METIDPGPTSLMSGWATAKTVGALSRCVTVGDPETDVLFNKRIERAWRSMEDEMAAERSRRSLNFQEKKEQLVKFLQSRDNAVMVLGTSCDDRVLVRNVLTVSDGLDIYFFTWGHSRKCDQIDRNQRVALCRDDVQIEGVAEILGGFNDEHAKRYVDLMRGKFPDAIRRWEKRPSMVMVRVKPTLAALGGSDEPPELEFLDLEHEVAYAEAWACY